MKQEADIDRAVKAVVRIIGSGKIGVAEVRHAVIAAQLSAKRNPTWPPYPENLGEKKELRRLASAMEALEKRLLGRAGQDRVIDEKLKNARPLTADEKGRQITRDLLLRTTHPVHDEFLKWLDQLKTWRTILTRFDGPASAESSVGLLTKRSSWLLGHKKKDTEQLKLKRRAVAAAAELLNACGMPLKATRRSATSKGSTFCQVAAALYGDARANLEYHCRLHLKKARKRV